MPLDRIDRTDPNLYRVQQTGDDKGRRRQEQEQKEKDKFEKPSLWKRVLGMNASGGRTPTLLAGKPTLRKATGLGSEEEEEKSLTLSERLLVLWGILEKTGRPRPLVILTYVLILGMILGATILIIGMTLWQ